MKKIYSNRLGREIELETFNNSCGEDRGIRVSSLRKVFATECTDYVAVPVLQLADDETTIYHCEIREKGAANPIVIGIGSTHASDLKEDIHVSYFKNRVELAASKAFCDAVITFLGLPDQYYSDTQILESKEIVVSGHASATKVETKEAEPAKSAKDLLSEMEEKKQTTTAESKYDYEEDGVTCSVGPDTIITGFGTLDGHTVNEILTDPKWEKAIVKIHAIKNLDKAKGKKGAIGRYIDDNANK